MDSAVSVLYDRVWPPTGGSCAIPAVVMYSSLTPLFKSVSLLFNRRSCHALNASTVDGSFR